MPSERGFVVSFGESLDTKGEPVTRDELALLEAIRDDPQDDAVRLIYADWLEDQGRNERAEFIRLQIAWIARMVDNKERAREKELRAQFTVQWQGPLAEAGLCFRRGMVATYWRSLEDFETGTARLAEAGDPAWVVQRGLDLIRPGTDPGAFEGLVRRPGFDRLTRCDLDGARSGSARRWRLISGVTTEMARALAESPLSVGLRGLSLLCASLGGGGGRWLGGSAYLGRLRWLDLSFADITPEGISALADSDRLTGLTALGLNNVNDPADVLEALSAGKGLSRLQTLFLTENRIGDGRLRQLLAAPWIGRLKNLVLACNLIRDGGARALAECAALSGLEMLDLAHNSISDEGGLALLESPHLRSLKKLILGYNPKLTESMRKKLQRKWVGIDYGGRRLFYSRIDWPP
jgi:uncharacterized protein (TIGR02996 family)